MRYLYGTPVLTLSEVVSEFNVAQNNVKENHFISNLRHAKWIWKELLWTNVWSLAQVYVPIVDGKIQLPQDVIRVVNISVMDKCGKIQPLGHNPNINTLDIRCSTNPCGCACGGEDTYCAQVEGITVKTEQVTIGDAEYPKTTYTRSDRAGNIFEIANIPTFDVATSEVVFIEQRTLLCKVEVTESGCIKATEPNRIALTQYCGCYFSYGSPDYSYLENTSAYWAGCCDWRHREECKRAIHVSHNDYGYYSWDAKANDIVHIKHTEATSVIVSYQTSGENGNQEMLIPEYALDAMMAGIFWRQRQYSPVAPWGDKLQSKFAYNAAKTALFEFQHPIRMDDFVRSQNILPTW